MSTSEIYESTQDIDNFIEALAEAHHQIERNINILLRTPDDAAARHNLFQIFYQVRGCAAICQLHSLARFSAVLENIANAVRSGSMPLSAELAEILLLGLDRLKLASETIAAEQPLDSLELESLTRSLDKIAETTPRSSNGLIKQTLGQFAGEAFHHEPVATAPTALQAAAIAAPTPAVIAPKPAPAPIPKPAAVKAAAPAAKPIKTETDPVLRKDLDFFRNMAKITERRSPHLEGRTDRVAKLALQINETAGNKVAPQQLEAAAYMHDIGMAFLSDAIWGKQGKLTELEYKELKSHTPIGSQLLTRMPPWQEAAEMVMQHHERVDGSGYPLGLKGNKILPGAALLAIVDAFEAMTHERGDRYQRRSIMRAVIEINASENQFSREWMPAFNQVIKSSLPQE